MIPVDGNVVPTGKYLKPPTSNGDLDIAIPIGIPTTSSVPPRSFHQRLEDLHKKMDRYKQWNQCQFTYVKKLLGFMTPPMEDPEIFTSTSDLSKDSVDGRDTRSSKTVRPLRLTNSTEDRAKS
ncbi:hypothetical protein AHAS_Ahas20G0154600 [Arachis hypogaea]